MFSMHYVTSAVTRSMVLDLRQCTLTTSVRFCYLESEEKLSQIILKW